MLTVIVRLTVAEFDRWHREYEQMHAHRHACGERGRQLFRDVDDPNTVVVVFQWDTVYNARTYFDSPKLRASVGRAGGLAAPQVSYLEVANDLLTPSRPVIGGFPHADTFRTDVTRRPDGAADYRDLAYQTNCCYQHVSPVRRTP